MSRTIRTVRLVGDERAQVQSALHDIQFSVRQYYRHTTGWPHHTILTTPARSTVGFIQKAHDVLGHAPKDGGIKNFTQYQELLDRKVTAGDAGALTIKAFTYLRNIGQHLVFPVEPDSGPVFGGQSGQRSYNPWAFVPLRAHNRLRTGTQKLRPHYRSHLEGHSITDTFLTALRFFADVCPTAIHRSEPHNDWTWFPLRSQPGVCTDRLHPEEPDGEAARLRWMRRRVPGGEFRIILGQVVLGGEVRLVGATFAQNHSYSGFVERPRQVTEDIDRGYKYFALEVGALPELEIAEYPEFGGGSRRGFRSRKPLAEVMGQPLTGLPRDDGRWTLIDQEQLIETFVSPEQAIYNRPDESFEVYRARRLYAEYPIQ